MDSSVSSALNNGLLPDAAPLALQRAAKRKR